MSDHSLMYKWLAVIFLSFSALEGVFEPDYEYVFHEGFISRDNGPPVFSALEMAPPPAILEQTPAQDYPYAQWLPGYWGWSADSKDYVWVTGAWRVPPPEMLWLPGEWSYFDELGWVWLNGFWSQQPLDHLAYIDSGPPDPVEQKPGFPESSNYFWNPGCWSYSQLDKKYEWLSGNWVQFDPNWVLVPAHYEWRKAGYIYIPAYWDWPVNKRGVAYLPVVVPKVGRLEAFMPTLVLEEQQIYQGLIIDYPNYLFVCQHVYHFHPERWATIAPTWWQWHSWWSMPWQNQWGLWWWFTHYGYPAPAGLTQDISERIRSANPRLLQLMSKAVPPFVISPKGMVPAANILNVLYKGKSTDKRVPILPSNPKALEKIQDAAGKEIKLPEKIHSPQREVDPSKRGKLYGVSEAVTSPSDVDVAPKEDVPRVSLPQKPVLTPGESKKATVKHSESESEEQPVKRLPVNVDISPIPVKALREAHAPAGLTKTAKPMHIPPPNPTTIQSVLPGPRVGPPIEFGEEENKVHPVPKRGAMPPVNMPPASNAIEPDIQPLLPDGGE